MASSGVGQFSINVKSNLRDFYGDLTKAKRTMKELTDRKNQLQIDSSQLDKLRDKSQRIAAEMRELRQQKTEIKLGMKNVENADEELKKIDQRIASLSRQKIEVDADIQPIRTANVELYKVEQEIDRINGKKIEVNIGDISGKIGNGLDNLSSKIMGVVKSISAISFSGLAGGVGILKEAVNAASDLEQNTGGVNKLFGEEASKDVMKKADNAYKTAGMSKNDYLEQATKYSASLITSLQEGQTVTIDSSDQKEALKKRKNEIEKALKENNYNSTEVSLSAEPQYEYITEKNGKIKKKKIEDTETKKQLKDYKRNKLELQKEKDKIDEQIANLPDKTTKKVGGMDKKVAQKKAAEYVDKALVDMSDNVNTFGGDAGLVQNTYGGLAKGNYAMLDNLHLGFKATQEGAIDVVNTYGKLDHKVTDISEVTFPMMVDAIHNAQEAMNISGTTAKEAATTYEGSLKMMKGAWNDFLATGDPSHLADSVPIYLENLDKKLKDLTPKIIEGVKQLVKELPPKLKPVLEDIKKILVESIDSIFGKGTVDNFVKGMKPFTDIIKKVFDMLSKSTKGEKPDLSWVGSVIPDLLKLAFGLKAASVAFKGVSVIFKGIALAKIIGFRLPSFKGLRGLGKSAKEMKSIGIEDLKSLGMKMLTIAGLSANIYLAAKALQQVQKIGDLGNLQPKMLAIAEAVAGMGVIAMAAGKLDQLTGGSLKKGLFYVAGVSADIYFAAKALQEVGKINSDFGSIQSKIGQIALSITEIGALALAVGAIMSTGVGAALLTTGLLAILGIAATLYLTGQAVASISNLELDSEKIETNIGIIKNTIDQMKGISGDDKLLENIKKFVNSLLDSGITTNIVSIGNKLIDIQELKFDGEKLQGNIQVIKGFIDKLDDFNFDANPFPALGKWFTSMFDNGIFGSIIKIGNKMTEMQKLTIDTDAVTTNIKAIQTAMSSIRDLYTGFDPDKTDKKGSKNWLEQAGEWAGKLAGFTPFGAAMNIGGELVDNGKGLSKVTKTWTESSAIGNIVSVGESIKKIQNLGLNEKQATTQVGIIKTMLSILSDVTTEENVKNMHGMSDALNKVVESLAEKFPPEFNDFGQLLAEKLNDGFKNKLNLQKVLSDKFTNLSTYGAVNVGLKIANAINNSLKSSLNIGDTIRNAISSALQEKYSTTIDVEINTKEKKKSNTKSKKSKITKAGGGIVSVKTDQAVLQDSPEKPLLDNGEYVIPKKIVSALGVPFFEKLRSGQISRTFAGLAQSVSHTTSSVVNNVYNTNSNNTQSYNVYTTGNEDFILQANRRFRKA